MSGSERMKGNVAEKTGKVGRGKIDYRSLWKMSCHI